MLSTIPFTIDCQIKSIIIIIKLLVLVARHFILNLTSYKSQHTEKTIQAQYVEVFSGIQNIKLNYPPRKNT